MTTSLTPPARTPGTDVGVSVIRVEGTNATAATVPPTTKSRRAGFDGAIGRSTQGITSKRCLKRRSLASP